MKSYHICQEINATDTSVLFPSLTLNSDQSTAGYGWTHCRMVGF